jgi:hypothetical protein
VKNALRDAAIDAYGRGGKANNCAILVAARRFAILVCGVDERTFSDRRAGRFLGSTRWSPSPVE